jgi:selenium metabolism protein YedF
MKTLDARRLACPAPVLLVKETLDKEVPAVLRVLVDNDAACENVGRFLGSRHYVVTVDRQGVDFQLTGVAEGAGAVEQISKEPGEDQAIVPKILVLIGSDRLGRGDDLLGDKLMLSFLKTLKEMGPELWQLIFVNSGVRLTIDDSPVLAELQEYENNGVIVLACGTCLTHFQLSERKRVGQTTNMLDIVTAMQLADKVISFG